MIMNRSSHSRPWQLFALVRGISFIACGIAVFTAFVYAQDLAQAESAVSEHDVSVDRSFPIGSTPTPFPCPRCQQQLRESENFDARGYSGALRLT
jgi:hypothetical protein